MKYSSIMNVLDCSGELDEPIKNQCFLKCSLQLPPLTDLGIQITTLRGRREKQREGGGGGRGNQ